MACKVSVSITTYNHESFIAQAIESALMQELDFCYEILVGEDDSSDRTRQIVREYQEKHPDKSRPPRAAAPWGKDPRQEWCGDSAPGDRPDRVEPHVHR